MPKLPTSFRGTSSDVSGNFGANAQAGLRNATQALDSTMDIANRRKEDADEAATSSVIAEAMRTGQSPAQIMAARDRIFSNPIPGVNYDQVGKAFDATLNAAMGRRVDESAIGANEASEALNTVKTEAFPAESQSRLNRDATENAKTNLEIGQLQGDAYKIKKREEGVKKFRSLTAVDSDGPGSIGQEINAGWEEYAGERGYSPAQRKLYETTWKEARRDDILANPEALNRFGDRAGLLPLQVEKFTQAGQRAKSFDDAMQAETVALGALASKAQSKTQDMMQAVGNGSNKNSVYNPDDRSWGYGVPAAVITKDSMLVQADILGLNIEDQDTLDVLNIIRDRFPESNAFSYMVGEVRDGLSSTLSKTDSKKAIAKQRDALKRQAKHDYAQTQVGPEIGTSASDIIDNKVNAAASFADSETQFAVDEEQKATAKAQAAIFNKYKPGAVDAAVTAYAGTEPPTADLKSRVEYFDSAADKLQGDLDIVQALPSAYRGRVGSDLTKLAKQIRYIRTGYSTQARTTQPASFKDRSAKLKAAMKTLQDIQGTMRHLYGLGGDQPPTGIPQSTQALNAPVTEAAFLRQLNR